MTQNSLLGHFEEQGRRFVIEEPRAPLRPWVNYLFNEHYYVGCDQFGRGMSQYQDGLGQWAIITMRQDEYWFTGDRGIYLRKSDGSDLWDQGGIYTQSDLDHHEVTVEPGLTHIETTRGGLATTWDLFVPVEGSVECWMLTYKNTTSEPLSFSAFPFACMNLTGFSFPEGSGSGDYNSFLLGRWLEDEGALLCENRNPFITLDKYNALFAGDQKAVAYDSVENALLGMERNYSFPRAVFEGRLTNSNSAGNNMVAALQFDFELAPGEEASLNLVLGSVGIKNGEYMNVLKQYREDGAFDQARQARRDWQQVMQNSFVLQTPDEDIDRMANIWVKQQVAYCVRFSRGWGKGYRDTLQDAQYYRLIENDPAWKDRQYAKYRETLASAFTHQYADGRGTRKWSPVSREDYSDAPLWLIFSAIDYLKETGDYDLLDTVFPYFDNGEDTAWEHLLQGARHVIEDRGRHGMVRVRFGDWNDGITGIGEGGEGESVMNTQMLYGCLLELKALRDHLSLSSKDGFADTLEALAKEVYRDVNANAWEGKYYTRAFNDAGEPVGTRADTEGRMYVETQAFGLSMGLASEEQAESIIRESENALEVGFGMRLLAPSYSAFDPKIGRLSGHVPGMWENGGVYCHGTAFYMMGLCRYGRADKALALYHQLVATNPAHPSTKSGLEPYIFTNCYAGPENASQAGFARRSWTTGTAAWLLQYLAEGFSGIRADYNGLRVEPCLPSAWSEMFLERSYRNKRFKIHFSKSLGVEAPEVKSITLNGHVLESNFIPLEACLEHNEVEVVMM